MAAELVSRDFEGPLASRLALVEDEAIVVNWLGQAGFIIRDGRRRILVDPYLSDTLAIKYADTPTPHDRLMPPPITVEELGRVDLALITHQHTDHMDPGTLAPLARLNPRLRFVAPRAARTETIRRAGVSDERLILLDAGETASPLAGVQISAIPAAHETLERDADGFHRFLGYGLAITQSGRAPVSLVHSGDTIPFPGQVEEVARLRPDLLMAPVNGRSARLAALGIAGNMNLDEAIELTVRSGAPAMIAHHHGMFAFNTLPLAEIEARAAAPGLPIRLIPAREGLEVRLTGDKRGKPRYPERVMHDSR
jgi:L-ascorbate metabolism protein UlaG (beta-lactamase superfamily)